MLNTLRARACLLAVLALGLVAAGPASASTDVSTDGHDVAITSTAAAEQNMVVAHMTDATHLEVQESHGTVTINGGAGCTANGPDSNSKLCVVSSPVVVTLHLGPGDDGGTVNAGDGAGALVTVFGNFYGEGGDDQLFGGSGDDFFDGGDGKDTMFGNAGADHFTDTGSDGQEDTASYTDSDHSAGVTVTMDDGQANDGNSIDDNGTFRDQVGTGIERLRGTPFADTVTGSGAAEHLVGGGGGDGLTGGGGADTFEGDSGADTINAQDGVVDAAIDCDNTVSHAADAGDIANVDSGDPAPQNCTTVNVAGPGGDTTPPNVTVADPSSNKLYDTGRPTFRGGADDATSVTVKLFQYNGADFVAYGSPLTATVSGGQWTGTPGAALPNGTYDVEATGKDASNNERTTSRVRFRVSVPVPTTPPPPDPNSNLVTADTAHTSAMPDLVGVHLLALEAALNTAKGGPINTDLFDERKGKNAVSVVHFSKAQLPDGIDTAHRVPGVIVSQSVRAGTPVTTGANTSLPLKLEVWGGPSKENCDEAARQLTEYHGSDGQGLPFSTFEDILVNTVGCDIDDVKVRFPKTTQKPGEIDLDSDQRCEVGRVLAQGRRAIDVILNIPKDPRKQDLFFTLHDFDRRPGVSLKDQTLPATLGTRSLEGQSAFAVEVTDRRGAPKDGVHVFMDASDAGAVGPEAQQEKVTSDGGIAEFSVTTPRPGKVHLGALGEGTNKALCGGHDITVANQHLSPGDTYETIGGETWKWTDNGFKRASAAGARAAAGFDFGALLRNIFLSIFRPGERGFAAATGGGDPQKAVKAAKKDGTEVGVLLAGEGPAVSAASVLLKRQGVVGVVGNTGAIGPGYVIPPGQNVLVGLEDKGRLSLPDGHRLSNRAVDIRNQKVETVGGVGLVDQGNGKGAVGAGSDGVIAASGLITNDGGSLIGNDGAGLIGNDGAGLIGNDGAGLIGNDGAGLIGNDGAGRAARGR
jgi:Bacterial Ig-like domain/RTX calcium-binding nonapeptide repeat (4 copies)